MDVDAHRPAVHDDLRRTVLVGAREDTVVVGRRAEFVDLLLQEFDLLLRLLQRVHQLLVLALGIAQLLAQHVVATARSVVLGEQSLETAAELGGVAAEEAQGVLQLFDRIAGHGAIAIGFVARPRT